MKKRILKTIKKNTVAVLVTMLFCLYLWSDYNQKVLTRMQELGEKEIKVKLDSIKNGEIIKIRNEILTHNLIEVENMKTVYQNEIADSRQRTKILNEVIYKTNEKLVLANLIESLRKDYGSIEPGVQRISNKEYMEKYRQHEATYVLAVDLAKKLDLYDEYQNFFKNREGTWNMLIADN